MLAERYANGATLTDEGASVGAAFDAGRAMLERIDARRGAVAPAASAKAEGLSPLKEALAVFVAGGGDEPDDERFEESRP
jgi:hypothetical protein